VAKKPKVLVVKTPQNKNSFLDGSFDRCSDSAQVETEMAPLNAKPSTQL
jgi:hypothetical protein